jgi:hypothetical protein
MSKTALEQRLVRQLSAKGVKGASGVARAALVKRGHMSEDGTLTAEGRKRQAMGADGRAKDRASKYSGRKASDYTYDKRTNRATLKDKK